MVPRELRTERLLLRQWSDHDVARSPIYEQPEFLATMPGKTWEETRDQIVRFRQSWERMDIASGRHVNSSRLG